MLTEDRVQTKILRRLGVKMVAVELDSDDWFEIFDDAYRWWVIRKSLTKKICLTLRPGMAVYEAPVDFKSLEKFIPPQLSRNPFDIDQVAETFRDETDRFYPMAGRLSEIVMQRQHDSEAMKIFGQEFEFVVDETNYDSSPDASAGVQFIVSPVPLHGGVGWLYYSSNKFTAADWRYLKPKDEELLLTCVEANAKIIVGRKRSKFQDFQLPGGILTMDGQALLTEGQAMLEQLEIDVNNSQDPMPMFIG